MEGSHARETESSAEVEPLIIGRYALFDVLAAGGMATVHIGRLLGPVGFSRTVAIKRLHQMYARDPEFVSMFLDEARLVARIRHPNVVQTVDVVATKGELFLVMDYVQGESLSRLLRALSQKKETMPLRIVSSVISGALQGLHAAHEAKDERGLELGIVHRDVSPQNVLVGADGLARVLDFGIAKAAGRSQSTTREGQVKGKLAYMSPEQVHAETITRKADIYAAAIVAWETLTTRRLFRAESETAMLAKVLAEDVMPPSKHVPGISPELDAVIMRGLARDPALRFSTAKEMALAIERCVPPASAAEVADWIAPILGPMLADRASLLAKIETGSGISSIDSLKERMIKELADSETPEDKFTSTQIGVGVAPQEPQPIVRTTTRLESAAKQAMARIAAMERDSAKEPSAPTMQPNVPAPMASAPSAPALPASTPSLATSAMRSAQHSVLTNPDLVLPQKRGVIPLVIAVLVMIALGVAALAFVVTRPHEERTVHATNAPTNAATGAPSATTDNAIPDLTSSSAPSASATPPGGAASSSAPSDDASVASRPSSASAVASARAPQKDLHHHGSSVKQAQKPIDPFDVIGGRH